MSDTGLDSDDGGSDSESNLSLPATQGSQTEVEDGQRQGAGAVKNTRKQGKPCSLACTLQFATGDLTRSVCCNCVAEGPAVDFVPCTNTEVPGRHALSPYVAFDAVLRQSCKARCCRRCPACAAKGPCPACGLHDFTGERLRLGSPRARCMANFADLLAACVVLYCWCCAVARLPAFRACKQLSKFGGRSKHLLPFLLGLKYLRAIQTGSLQHDNELFPLSDLSGPDELLLPAPFARRLPPAGITPFMPDAVVDDWLRLDAATLGAAKLVLAAFGLILRANGLMHAALACAVDLDGPDDYDQHSVAFCRGQVLAAASGNPPPVYPRPDGLPRGSLWLQELNRGYSSAHRNVRSLIIQRSSDQLERGFRDAQLHPKLIRLQRAPFTEDVANTALAFLDTVKLSTNIYDEEGGLGQLCRLQSKSTRAPLARHVASYLPLKKIAGFDFLLYQYLLHHPATFIGVATHAANRQQSTYTGAALGPYAATRNDTAGHWHFADAVEAARRQAVDPDYCGSRTQQSFAAQMARRTGAAAAMPVDPPLAPRADLDGGVGGGDWANAGAGAALPRALTLLLRTRLAMDSQLSRLPALAPSSSSTSSSSSSSSSSFSSSCPSPSSSSSSASSSSSSSRPSSPSPSSSSSSSDVLPSGASGTMGGEGADGTEQAAGRLAEQESGVGGDGGGERDCHRSGSDSSSDSSDSSSSSSDSSSEAGERKGGGCKRRKTTPNTIRTQKRQKRTSKKGAVTKSLSATRRATTAKKATGPTSSTSDSDNEPLSRLCKAPPPPVIQSRPSHDSYAIDHVIIHLASATSVALLGVVVLVWSYPFTIGVSRRRWWLGRLSSRRPSAQW
jgi:hypothetical protein